MLPVIDIGPLFTGGTEEQLKTSMQIEDALKTTGFFYIVNHGLSTAELTSFLEHGKRFFSTLDMHEKMRIKRNDKVGSNGYVAIGAENLQDGDQTIIDFKEAMDVCDPHPLYKNNPWPEEAKLPGWKERTLEIQQQFINISLKLVEAFALALGEDPSFFKQWYEQKAHCSLLRFLRYPPTPNDKGHTGCGAHSDYGILTLLLQDSVGGLQVLKDGEWVDVVPLPGSFVVNVGDCIEMMTNGAYKATKHKVRNVAEKDRSVTVFFFEPAVEMPIEVVKKFRSDGEEKVLKTYGEHLIERLSATYV